MKNIQTIILAGGLGKRMNNFNLPKVLIELKGQPLISYVLKTIVNSGIDPQPVIVVGKMADKVKETLGPEYQYIFQPEQLGTGHAVACTKETLKDRAENILVLYGDMPLITAETIKNIATQHLVEKAVITMATVTVPDFNDWRAGFYDFGRIIRDSQGELLEIVEKKDATPDQLAIKEVNPSYFCFEANWLWQNIDNLKNDNLQKEYYLTDLISLALIQNKIVKTINIKAEEALGINDQKQKEIIEKFL